MININLVPYREKLKETRKRKVIAGIVGLVAATASLLLLGNSIITDQIQDQSSVNSYLSSVDKQLSAKVKSIAELKSIRERLIDRSDLIGRLESKRSMSVRIFNELPSISPSGVFIRSFSQVGDVVQVDGYALSNQYVADFMRNVQNSKIFSNPVLVYTSHSVVKGQKLYDFSMHFSLVYAGGKHGDKS